MSNATRLMATVVGLGGLLWATGSTLTAGQTDGRVSVSPPISEEVEAERETSVEISRESTLLWEAPRVTEDPLSEMVLDSRLVMDSLTVLGSPTDNIIACGGQIAPPEGTQSGSAIVNLILAPRSANTRDRMVKVVHCRAVGRPVPPPAAPVQAPPVNVTRTAGKNGVMVESRDRANPGVVIHRTFIAK